MSTRHAHSHQLGASHIARNAEINQASGAEAMQKLIDMTDRTHSATLTPKKFAGEDVWYVQVLWLDGRSEQVGAFRTKAETEDWIAHKSGAWLDDYVRRRR